MPISRYTYSNQSKLKTGERFVKSTLYPPIPRSPQDFYIISRPGDRLDLLSQEFYKTPAYWWVIAIANSFVKASLYIPPNEQIRIPGNISSVINNLDNIQKAK